MSARDVIDVATDIACGVGNRYDGHIYTGTDRDTIELGIRRLTAAGYRLIGPTKFAIGQRVTKIKGSSWTGKVVGFYSTSLTPMGYAVESENEPGAVQIYPETALRALQSQEAGNEG